MAFKISKMSILFLDLTASVSGLNRKAIALSFILSFFLEFLMPEKEIDIVTVHLYPRAELQAK